MFTPNKNTVFNLRFDDKNIRARPKQTNDSIEEDKLPRSTQFGVTLKFINTNSPCLNYIPPIVRKCVDSLSLTGVIDTEGIFRRSGTYSTIGTLKKQVNSGQSDEVDFKDIDTHVLAGLLKSFLRDLSEPLLTYELYDEIVKFKGRLVYCVFLFVLNMFYTLICSFVSYRMVAGREIA